MTRSATVSSTGRRVPPVQAPDLSLCLLEDAMRAKQSLITRVIVSAAAVGSIATGIAVPVASAVTPATTAVAITASSNMIGHIG
jgi:hypothetical protein